MGQEWNKGRGGGNGNGNGDGDNGGGGWLEADEWLHGVWPRSRFLIVYTARLLQARPSWQGMIAEHRRRNCPACPTCRRDPQASISYRVSQRRFLPGFVLAARSCAQWVCA